MGRALKLLLYLILPTPGILQWMSYKDSGQASSQTSWQPLNVLCSFRITSVICCMGAPQSLALFPCNSVRDYSSVEPNNSQVPRSCGSSETCAEIIPLSWEAALTLALQGPDGFRSGCNFERVGGELKVQSYWAVSLTLGVPDQPAICPFRVLAIQRLAGAFSPAAAWPYLIRSGQGHVLCIKHLLRV